jgi:hypothetical protein
MMRKAPGEIIGEITDIGPVAEDSVIRLYAPSTKWPPQNYVPETGDDDDL